MESGAEITAKLTQAVERLERDNAELKQAVADLQKQVRQRELDAAYMYIHSNWLWIRWFLVRDQDRGRRRRRPVGTRPGRRVRHPRPPAAQPALRPVRPGTHAGRLSLAHRNHRHPQPPRLHLL